MNLLDSFRAWKRRRKLRKGYVKIAEADLDKSVGFTPTMHALAMMEEDGYIEIDDGQIEWVWP